MSTIIDQMISTTLEGPNSPLHIKQESKFFARLLSKETTPSFRVYYDVAPRSIPFMWETQPGTPKATINLTNYNLPPLTPPPCYLYKNPNHHNPNFQNPNGQNPNCPKAKGHKNKRVKRLSLRLNGMVTMLLRLCTSRRACRAPKASPPSSLSSPFSPSSSPYSRLRSSGRFSSARSSFSSFSTRECNYDVNYGHNEAVSAKPLFCFRVQRSPRVLLNFGHHKNNKSLG